MNLEGTIHRCFYPEVTRDGKANGVDKSEFNEEAKLSSNVHASKGKWKILHYIHPEPLVSFKQDCDTIR